MSRARVAGAAAAALAALAWPERAEAFERQWHVGAQASYDLFIRPSIGGIHGVAGGAHLAYGLNDMFNLIFDVGVGVFPNPGYDPAMSRPELVIPRINAGASYVFDVIQWVPWVGLTVGAADVIGTSQAACFPGANGAVPTLCNEFRLGLSVPFGVDYQPNRSLAVGLSGRYTLMLFGPDVEHLVTVGIRVEHMWGY